MRPALCLRLAAGLLVVALLAAAPASGQSLGTQQRISHTGPPDGEEGFAAIHPAIAYNAQANQFLVVWSGEEVDLKVEIFGRLIDGAGNPLGPEFRITEVCSDCDASEPAVAYSPQRNEYLVTWTGDDNVAPLVNNELEIFGQRLTAAGVETGAEDFRISAMGPNGSTAYGAFAPAVAYNTQSSEYLVTWAGDDNTGALVDGEIEIYGQRLTATGAETGSDDFRISAMGPDGDASFDASEVGGGVSGANGVAYNADANEYLVTWSADDNTPPLVDNETEVYGQRLSASGAETGSDDFRISAMGPDGDASFDAITPAAAFNAQADEYLVTWSADDNTPPLVDTETEVYGQRLSATGAETGSDDFRISAMGPDGSASFRASSPALAYDAQANEYLVVWSGDDDTPPLTDGEIEVHGQRLSATGAETGGDDFRISAMGPDGSNSFTGDWPAVASNQAGAYQVVWDGSEPPMADGENEIFGRTAALQAPIDTDGDDDGADDAADCDDANPGIRPGAVDVPGNGVDEDCSGADAQSQNQSPPATEPQPAPVISLPPPSPAPPTVAGPAPRIAGLLTLPSPRRCASRRKFTVRVRREIRGSVRQVTIFINGRRAKRVTGARIGLPIDLRGLPKGKVKVRLRVELADGRVATDTRTYRTCATKKRRGRFG